MSIRCSPCCLESQVTSLHLVHERGPEVVRDASTLADALFRGGAEVVYMAVDGTQLILSETQPDERVVILARSVDQVRRFTEALIRGEPSPT